MSRFRPPPLFQSGQLVPERAWCPQVPVRWSAWTLTAGPGRRWWKRSSTRLLWSRLEGTFTTPTGGGNVTHPRFRFCLRSTFRGNGPETKAELCFDQGCRNPVPSSPGFLSSRADFWLDRKPGWIVAWRTYLCVSPPGGASEGRVASRGNRRARAGVSRASQLGHEPGPGPSVSCVVGAFREALIAVDRHSRTETQEFLPQKRSRLYGLAATPTQCPQGEPGSVQSQDRTDPPITQPIEGGEGGVTALKLTPAFSPQSTTTVPTTAAALTCACHAPEASPAAARTPPAPPPPGLRVQTQTCEPDSSHLSLASSHKLMMSHVSSTWGVSDSSHFHLN